MSSQIPLRPFSSATSTPARPSTLSQYNALETGHIRLLELLPEIQDGGNTVASEVIQCRLLHVPLKDAKTYEALSYVWGHDDPSHEIQIVEDSTQLSSISIKVTQNLFNALKLLRRDTPRILWIDQLCID